MSSRARGTTPRWLGCAGAGCSRTVFRSFLSEGISSEGKARRAGHAFRHSENKKKRKRYTEGNNEHVALSASRRKGAWVDATWTAVDSESLFRWLLTWQKLQSSKLNLQVEDVRLDLTHAGVKDSTVIHFYICWVCSWRQLICVCDLVVALNKQAQKHLTKVHCDAHQRQFPIVR